MGMRDEDAVPHYPRLGVRLDTASGQCRVVGKADLRSELAVSMPMRRNAPWFIEGEPVFHSVAKAFET